MSRKPAISVSAGAVNVHPAALPGRFVIPAVIAPPASPHEWPQEEYYPRLNGAHPAIDPFGHDSTV